MVETGPHTISLGDLDESLADEWVKIKPHRPYKVAKLLEQSVMKDGRAAMRGDKNDQRMEIEIGLIEQALAVQAHLVVEWALTGHDGQSIECSRAGVLSDNMPDWKLEWIMDQVDAFYDSQRPDFLRGEQSD